MAQIDSLFLKSVFESHGSSQFSIRDVKSKKARNILRGVDPSSYSKTVVALEKIKSNCHPSDYKKSVLFVRSSSNFDDSYVGQFFSNKCPKGLSETPSFTKKEIVREIRLHKDKLETLLDDAFRIYESLRNNDLAETLKLCEEMAANNGVSVFLIRILYYVKNRIQVFQIDNDDLILKLDGIFIKIGLPISPYIEDAMNQLSNLRISHLAIFKKIRELKINHIYGGVPKFFIKILPEDESDFLSTLNSFFSYSLFDALLYIFLTKKFGLEWAEDEFPCHELYAKYEKICAVNIPPESMYPEFDEDTSYLYYREAFLLLENTSIVRFFLTHNVFQSGNVKFSNSSSFLKGLVSSYFHGLTNISELCYEVNEVISIDLERYNKNSCGMMENSSALVYLVNKKHGVLDEHEKEPFIKLMSYTRGIGELCNPEYLEEISNLSSSNMIKLVLDCLITISKKSNLTEHQLRSTLQDYCVTDFNGNLTELLKFLYRISPSVTEHLILICNETFLSTLFHLMDKPVDALQMRADMLQWFGEETGDSKFLDRAKTLRIDIQINKEKGTIDDSRIYVDPLKYTQWFEDNMVNKLTVSLESVSKLNIQVVTLDWSGKNISISNSDEVVEKLLACYKEFCENKVFGIASYLGRRIRHGTFRGTAVTELHAIIKKEEYVHLFEDKEFARKYSAWLANYESMIDDLIKTYLQIKSKKKPNGIITTEIDSTFKLNTAKQWWVDIFSIYSKRNGIVLLPSLIIDYCWRLVEFDLVNTKKLLSEKKSSYGVFSYTPKVSSSNLKKQFSKFVQEVNAITTKKFGVMSSWFNKPSYASPSTDIYLLFNAVVSEVKDSVSNFYPKIDIGERSFAVNGGTYYVIYDALFVLIDNAARHGKSDGKITFAVSKPSDRNAIHLNLTTELDNLSELNRAYERISAALVITDDDAHIVEGNSGIKKLKKLESEGSISDLLFKSIEDEFLLSAEFYFELGNRGKQLDIDN